MKPKFNLEGIFELTTINKFTGEVLQNETIKNTIVNTGLERIAKLLNGVSTTSFDVLAIGTGTTSVTNSDASLESEVTRAAATTTYEADYKAVFEKTFTFASGESYAITEAGAFDSLTVSGSTMWNRTTFSAKNVDSNVDLIVKLTVTASRA